jgi:hypothetical protein
VERVRPGSTIDVQLDIIHVHPGPSPRDRSRASGATGRV